MNEFRVGSKITLKSDKGVFTIVSAMKQKDGIMYEVTNGAQTFWTNRANFGDKPKIEQMSLFDFAEEIANLKPEEPKVRVYEAGDRFSNGCAYGKEMKRHLMTYYDIAMPFGEFLKFLQMKEVEA